MVMMANVMPKRTGVEEHVTDGGGLSVHLEWMAGQHDPLCDDTCGICIQEIA